MAVAGKKERHEQLCREVLEGAPECILLTGVDGPWIDALSRRTGHTTRKLCTAFSGKAKLIDFILCRHLDEAFEAVCVPSDWSGPPIDVLRSMSLALVGYGGRVLARHRVFLAERERRPEAARRSLQQQQVYLANNFQVAMRAVTPDVPFAELHTPACLLLGQLLHAPLWWPPDAGPAASPTTVDAWVCTQIGLLTGSKRPDHRRPSRATRPDPPTELQDVTGSD